MLTNDLTRFNWDFTYLVKSGSSYLIFCECSADIKSLSVASEVKFEDVIN